MCVLRFLLLLVVIGGVSRASAQESTDLRNGLSLSRDLCASCHAVGKNERRSPVSGASPFVVIAAVPGMTSAALHAYMQTSHPSMPNVILRPEDRRDVVAYILSLKAD